MGARRSSTNFLLEELLNVSGCHFIHVSNEVFGQGDLCEISFSSKILLSPLYSWEY